MTSVYPDFYADFKCRASACGHSCCRGWEIDVDAESAGRYLQQPGELGEALRAALIEDADGWHFRLVGEARCPFLRPDGLCRLIFELGEDSLCDICALHPRFFADCGEYELCGLGLSCEAATALLLSTEAPLRFFTEGESAPLSLEELLGRLGRPCAPERLRFAPRTERESRERLLRAFAATEPIDEHWREELAALGRALRAPDESEGPPEGGCYARIFGYILYRQLERLPGSGLEALLEYARRCTEFIFWQDRIEPDTAEHLRRWSEQIEYSTENVDILLNAFSDEQ